jgi:hypothetical protein
MTRFVLHYFIFYFGGSMSAMTACINACKSSGRPAAVSFNALNNPPSSIRACRGPSKRAKFPKKDERE